MFGLMRWLRFLTPLHETPADGGGGGAWPDYETPAGVGDTGTEEQPAAGAAAPAQPAGATGEPHTQPGERRAEGQPAGQAGGRQGLPQYRQDQIEQRDFNNRVNAEVKAQLKSLFGPALGLNDAPEADPRTARIRETLFKVVPELKDIVEKLGPKAKELLGLAESAPQWQQQNSSYWGGVAARTTQTMHDGVAKLMLGEGKSGKDLDPEMADEVKEIFIRWIERDTTGGRVTRYEAQDANLVNEFLRAFGARYIDPARRLGAVSIAERGQRVARLPVAGSGGTPPAATPPKVDLNDEEAVHGRGFAVMTQLRGA